MRVFESMAKDDIPGFSLASAKDALTLPRGALFFTFDGGGSSEPHDEMALSVELDVLRDEVLEAASVVVAKNDRSRFRTQAEVIACAGNRYGWGGLAGSGTFSTE